MADFVAPSGAKVQINVAPWVDAKVLKKAIQNSIDFDGNDIGFTEKWIIGQLCHVDGSDAFDSALFSCLKWCTYNDARITPETFNTKEARADYFDIVVACVKENLSPLVESLSSKLFELGILKKRAENQA